MRQAKRQFDPFVVKAFRDREPRLRVASSAASPWPSAQGVPLYSPPGWSSSSRRNSARPRRSPGSSRSPEIEPRAAEWDREHRFPRELYDRLAELGLMGVQFRGSWRAARTSSRTCWCSRSFRGRTQGVGVTVAVHTSAATPPIVVNGTPEQCETHVPPLRARGAARRLRADRSRVRSDAASLRARAERDGDGWRITGLKQWSRERPSRRHVHPVRAHRRQRLVLHRRRRVRGRGGQQGRGEARAHRA